jgi:hypothetical protein
MSLNRQLSNRVSRRSIIPLAGVSFIPRNPLAGEYSWVGKFHRAFGDPYAWDGAAPIDELSNNGRNVPVAGTREANERDEIVRILKVTNGRVAGPDGAASRMDIKRTTLISRMKKLGIDPRRVSWSSIQQAFCIHSRVGSCFLELRVLDLLAVPIVDKCRDCFQHFSTASSAGSSLFH